MFLPYSTDAPVYYWPYATVGLILANVLLFLGVTPDEVMDPGGMWLLRYGEGLHPDQWVGSRFMHAGPMHLIGNMLFLWVFGLVVEGKLGALPFLACYFVIGLGQAMVEQLCMLGYQGDVPGSLGASAAIYGVMAMAIIWAPDNEVSFFYWVIYPGSGEASILTFGGAFIALDITFALIFGGYAASSVLHVMGAALGWVIGLAIFKAKLVDCEGWDLFARYGKSKKEEQTQQPEAISEIEAAERQEEEESNALADAQAKFDACIANNAPSAALKVFQVSNDRGVMWMLNKPRLQSLVRGLHAERKWAEVAPLMAELIELDGNSADGLRVTLAQICMKKLDRPGRALELLDEVDPQRLKPAQRQAMKETRVRAEEMLSAGAVEIDVEDW